MPTFPLSPEPRPDARLLRLVIPDQGPGLEESRARHAVATENRRAAALAAAEDPAAEADVRRIFSIRVAHSLEGGRAAILTPDNRRRLVSDARRAGLRAFDANLIIAIVQDSARRGEPPHARATDRLLDLIPSRHTRDERQLLIQRLIIAAIIATGFLSMMIRWVTGG